MLTARDGRGCTECDRRDGLTMYSVYTVCAVPTVLSFASGEADARGKAGVWLTGLTGRAFSQSNDAAFRRLSYRFSEQCQ